MVKPELPLDLVADIDTLPILTTAPNIRSYDQESLEDSLIVRDKSQTETCQILDDETIRTKSLPDIHKLITNQSKVPQIFVDKLVSLHMGHLSLSVEDLSEYFFHLDRVFNTFAHHSQDFQTLTKSDQAALLIANAPLYYHLYLTRYSIAADGLDQLKVLLGNSLPQDLRDFDNFLTISFRYFASTMNLFKDSMWLDQYEDGTHQLNTKETQNVDSIAACILFNFRNGIFDEPEKIVKLYVKQLSLQCNNDKIEMERMNNVVLKLRSQIQRYCHGATLTMIGSAMRSTTNVSISVLPKPNYHNSEEVYWMERQLRICHEKCVNECKFSSQFLDDLIRQGHSLDTNYEEELVNGLQKRCHLLLVLHHEYLQLCEDKTLQDILQIVERNVEIAVAFLLAYIDTKDVELQIELLEGDNTQQIFSATKYQISISQITPSDQNLMKIQSMFRLYKLWLSRYPHVNSWKYAYLVTLVILWNTGVTSNDCDTLCSRISSIRDRYQAYFVHKLFQDSNSGDPDFAETALKELMQITAN